MSLRRTALILIALTIAVSVLILFIYSRYFLLSSFRQLENDLTARNLVRVNEALSNKLVEMARMTNDYAGWDDTYKFMADKNPAYIKSNLTDTTFDNLQINLMVFIKNSGEIVQANYYDLIEKKQFPLPASLKKDWSSLYPLFMHRSPDSRISGVLVQPEGVWLLVSDPILTSQSKGPIRGSLLVGLYLDQREIELLKKQTNLAFSIKLLNDPALPADFKNAAAKVAGTGKSYIAPITDELNGGYQVMNDLNGKPAIIIRVEIAREVTKQGQGLVWNFSVFLAIVGAILTTVILFLLESMILDRVFKIGSEVNAIAKSGDSSKRVKFAGKDELGALARRINDMLDALYASRLKLNESENRFKQLFDATPEAIFLEDIEGRILDCNQAALKMSGYSREELLKLRAYDLVPAEVAKTFGNLIAQVQAVGSFQTETQGKRKSGDVYPQEVIVRSIEIESIKYFLVVIRDISERKILGHKLNERVEELEQFHDTVIGRELKMMELEKEIDALLVEMGRSPKYNKKGA
jgi:PAS domain S-box-containing protein